MATVIVGWAKIRLIESGQAIGTIVVRIARMQPSTNYLRKRSSKADFERSIAAVSLAT